ncbi:S26 family signal peptidase, partial [Hydrotalea sp.]|uniref:S26 family signal peptidase n=1 Tax=Hydrotalea sp. TaxID=2881279 RepID=UPI00258F510C
MSLDDFNKKIDLPGDAGPPSFEESEWDKMEALLDTHLPQKKDRRRFIFWLFAMLVSLGLFSAYYFMYKPAVGNVESVNTTSFIKDHNSSSGTIEKADQKTNNEKIESNSITVADKNIQPPADNNEKVNGKTNLYQKNNNNLNNLSVAINRKINTDRRTRDENNMTSILRIPSQNTNNTLCAEPKMETVQTVININNNNKPVVTDTNTLKISKEQTIEKKNSKSDIKKIKGKNNFYITLSIGLEANGTRISSFGTITPIYSAGLQYAIGNKLFIRAGVFATKKLYDAKDKDYIKRVLATAGDTVAIENGKVYVNDKQVHESEYLPSNLMTSNGNFL